MMKFVKSMTAVCAAAALPRATAIYVGNQMGKPDKTAMPDVQTETALRPGEEIETKSSFMNKTHLKLTPHGFKKKKAESKSRKTFQMLQRMKVNMGFYEEVYEEVQKTLKENAREWFTTRVGSFRKGKWVWDDGQCCEEDEIVEVYKNEVARNEKETQMDEEHYDLLDKLMDKLGLAGDEEFTEKVWECVSEEEFYNNFEECQRSVEDQIEKLAVSARAKKVMLHNLKHTIVPQWKQIAIDIAIQQEIELHFSEDEEGQEDEQEDMDE